ncbi:hypothetical protein V6N11_079414 [Hibiscus sabdariffa]|uniref:Reverse transcriptase zinc-binding domain-containing protein n=1 Tax=Hibiscus sabdariffa TaxID=183260 RepID=A0ABR2RVL6_9ROSI
MYDSAASQVQQVSDLLDIHDQWDIVKLSSMFNSAVISHILSIRPPDESDMHDKLIWGLNAKNAFDIKFAYAFLNGGTWDSESRCWKVIWTLQVPQRLRLFLWISYKDKLMTNVEHCRRSLCQQSLCHCCHATPETLTHSLRDCKYVKGIWSRLLLPQHFDSFFCCDFRSWLVINVVNAELHPALGIPWHLLFASTL